MFQFTIQRSVFSYRCSSCVYVGFLNWFKPGTTPKSEPRVLINTSVVQSLMTGLSELIGTLVSWKDDSMAEGSLEDR